MQFQKCFKIWFAFNFLILEWMGFFPTWKPYSLSEIWVKNVILIYICSSLWSETNIHLTLLTVGGPCALGTGFESHKNTVWFTCRSLQCDFHTFWMGWNCKAPKVGHALLYEMYCNLAIRVGKWNAFWGGVNFVLTPAADRKDTAVWDL